MSKFSGKNKSNSRKKIDTAIVVALIALLGTIITAIFASPAINKLIESGGKSDPQLDTPSSPHSWKTEWLYYKWEASKIICQIKAPVLQMDCIIYPRSRAG